MVRVAVLPGSIIKGNVQAFMKCTNMDGSGIKMDVNENGNINNRKD